MNTLFRDSFRHTTFDQNTLRVLYRRHKTYLFPFLAFTVSLVIIVVVIIPEVQQMFALKSQEEMIGQKITIIRQNLTFLSTLNDANTNKQLQTATTALPSEKDFTGILSTISQAAAESGVLVGDFSFQVGELSASSKTTSLPTIDIVLAVSGGGIEGIKRFLHELANRFPLSQITSVHVNDTTSSVTVSFFFRPFPSLKTDGSQTISPLSQSDISVLDKLSSFKQ